MSKSSGGGTADSTVPTTEVLQGLNDLLQLDHDAIAAYQVALEKLENPEWVERVSAFLLDHERHVRQLNELIAELGGAATNEPHVTGPFKEALQSLGALGGDRGLLVAFRANEIQVRTKYDRYATRADGWPANVKRVVEGNALDEERHYQWVVSALDELGASRVDADEEGLLGRVHAPDPDALRDGVAANVRANPLRAVLVTFAAGFAVGRILR